MLMMIISLIFLSIPFQTVLAQSEKIFDLDKSEVSEDLSSFIVDGESFDFNNYPLNSKGSLQLINFVEYCYSLDNSEDYSLYIYVYNPAQIKINDTHILNRIKLAVGFNDLSYASEYAYFNIKFISKTEDLRFYKFKVLDNSNRIFSVVNNYAKTNDGVRQYYVSSIELVSANDFNAKEYNVAMNYQYTGFAEGYGDSENFPLTMTSSGIETLQTEVHYTWWRPEGETEGGNNIQSQLNSVYFSVPNELIEKYGVLQAVSMEWYEYLTKPVFITGNSTIYNHLINYVGDTFSSYSEDAKYGFAVNKVEAGPNDQYPLADYTYNAPGIILNPKNNGEALSTLYYLFKSNSSNVKDYILPSEDLLSYIQTYKGSGDKINDKYYSELFENYVDEGHIKGYNQAEIKAEDNFSLTSYTISQNWWKQIFNIYEAEEFTDIKGIEEILSSDLLITDSAFSSKYYINETDVPALKKYCTNSITDDKTVFLLRYSVTSYESKTATEVQGTKSLGLWFSEEIDKNAYMMRETVFLDLDLIDVTFYKDGVSTVIPVVSNPIDGVADGTPPVEKPDWLKYLLSLILGIVILILVLWLLGPILPWILKGVIWVITLPFRAIKAIIKSLKKKE